MIDFYEIMQRVKDILAKQIGNFTLFFHPFHFLPSTFPTLKQASEIVA
ncbi:MAG: hypothetical protein FAF03_09810 [Epsilonproteobacteria bacterium]|nr:hypothetical protein [Campylobacterota bacterium]